MTRLEKIKQAASEIFTENCWEYEEMRSAFITGAKWADKNPWVKRRKL